MIRSTAIARSIALALVLLLTMNAHALGQQRGRTVPRSSQRSANQPSHAEAVATRVAAVLDELERSSDFSAAARAADQLFDQVLAYAPAKDQAAFRQAAYLRRLVSQLAQARTIDQIAMLRYLRANPRLGGAIAFGIRPGDRVQQVYEVLDQLRQQRGEHLEKFAFLAAAISVVHERELRTRVNENVVASPAPLELFDYYAGNERRMFFGIQEVPVELLIYVVDIGATIPEMQWALRQHGGNRNVGKLFFTISYDYAHYRSGTPKRVTMQGFNLPNIQQFGGVCADQAHYAVTVGKAIGVPAVYAVGRSSEVGHAWVGFLEQRGRQGAWNFDHGRYAAYQGVRGITRDPQSRQMVDDSYISLLAELIGTTETQRYYAAAMTDASERLHEIAASGGAWSPAPLVKPTESAAADGDEETAPPPPPSPRATDIDQQLALLEAGLREANGYLGGWMLLAKLAESGEMTLEQKRWWSDVVMRLCGRSYPDFAVSVLRPMVQTIEDLNQQNIIWERMFQMFARRSDLAAEIRMLQGQMWEQAGEFVKAGRMYEDVIGRYANAGPFVLEAVVRAEAMLHEAGMSNRVPRLYHQSWSAVEPPSDAYAEFQRQSNWYRLGVMYAKKLRELGDAKTAERTEAQLTAMLSQR